jgi:hypothetical protein
MATTEILRFEDIERHADAGRLYFVFDGTAAPGLVSQVREFRDATCLFEDTPQHEFWAVAPYLLPIDRDRLAWVIANGAAEKGVWVLGRVPVSDATQHLRQLLFAVLPDGKEYLFRYYDPRVLPAFVSTCRPDDIRELYGPLNAFLVASADDRSRDLRAGALALHALPGSRVGDPL